MWPIARTYFSTPVKQAPMMSAFDKLMSRGRSMRQHILQSMPSVSHSATSVIARSIWIASGIQPMVTREALPRVRQHSILRSTTGRFLAQESSLAATGPTAQSICRGWRMNRLLRIGRFRLTEQRAREAFGLIRISRPPGCPLLRRLLVGRCRMSGWLMGSGREQTPTPTMPGWHIHLRSLVGMLRPIARLVPWVDGHQRPILITPGSFRCCRFHSMAPSFLALRNWWVHAPRRVHDWLWLSTGPGTTLVGSMMSFRLRTPWPPVQVVRDRLPPL